NTHRSDDKGTLLFPIPFSLSRSAPPRANGKKSPPIFATQSAASLAAQGADSNAIGTACSDGRFTGRSQNKPDRCKDACLLAPGDLLPPIGVVSAGPSLAA